MKLTIFGTGYVGLVAGASLADFGHQVLCVDVDPEKINSLERGELPFYEPGLKELVLKNKEKKRLFFSLDLREGIRYGEALFICVGTPTMKDGRADLHALWTLAEEVAHYAKGYKLLVLKSTVPPGTTKLCQQEIIHLNPSAEIEVVSHPEFLKQGNAVYDFNHPDKIIVGARSERAFQLMRRVYHGLVKTYIPFLEMDPETAEMTKYANNAFLATKISFINEIANICGFVGADVGLVAKAIGMDHRIGPKFLHAGMGYGGSCFPKDVQALVATAQEWGYEAKLLQEVHHFNERQKYILLPRILEKLREVQGDTITFWGVSFKPKTSDVRGAPAIALGEELLQQGITLRIYDPVAAQEAKKIFGNKVIFCTSLEDSVRGSSGIILATEWDEFRNVSFSELGKLMKHKILFDGRNIYDAEQIHQEGFAYYSIGRK